MEIDQLNSCCGIYELNGLDGAEPLCSLTTFQLKLHGQTPEALNVLLSFAEFVDRDLHNRAVKKPFVIFTDAIRGGVGPVLAGLIENSNLGTINTQPARRNPNSGNRIQIWIWEPNYKGLARFLKRQIADVAKEDKLEAAQERRNSKSSRF